MSNTHLSTIVTIQAVGNGGYSVLGCRCFAVKEGVGTAPSTRRTGRRSLPADFHIDNDLQQRVRDHVLAPGFYSRHGRFVFIDSGPADSEVTLALQKQFGVDTVMQGADGRAVYVEEKIVRAPLNGGRYREFALEIESSTDGKPGWMRYSKADYLLQALCQIDETVDVYLIHFPALQSAFFANHQSFPTKRVQVRPGGLVSKVPIDWVFQHALTRHLTIQPNPLGLAAVRAFNGSHFSTRTEKPPNASDHQRQTG